MTINTLNEHFSPKRFILVGQWELLIKQGLVFCTEAQLTDSQALAWIPPLTEKEKQEERRQLIELAGMTDEMVDHIQRINGGRYGGHIIVNNPKDWEEANAIASQRGFGERVIGVLGGSVPLDDKATQERVRLN